MARRSIAREVEAVRRNLDNHPIVIVGLMGAGKSSVSKLLADMATNLGWKAPPSYTPPWPRTSRPEALDRPGRTLYKLPLSQAAE